MRFARRGPTLAEGRPPSAAIGVPGSLFGRTALLICTLLIVGQLISAALVRQLIVRPRAEQVADNIAQNVSAIRAGLAALPPAQRAAFVAALNRQSLEAHAGAAPRMRAGERLAPIERAFVRTASARMARGGGSLAWRREAGGNFEVRLPLDGADHWIAVPGLQSGRDFTGAWLVASLVSALLSLGGALLIQRRLDRPLRRVVDAARSIAQGRMPPPLPEDGPEETATLSRSINQMTASLGRAERERALMLAGLSHDLRTPMAKLRLGLEILGDQAEPALRTRMTRSIEEMDAIVGQFLDFARADDAEAFIEGDLDALVSEAAAALSEQGQDVTLHLGAPTPVRMRPLALRRATMNLVENAFRHGRPPVEVSTGVSATLAWVEVRDHGRGIAETDIDRVREPFRRGSEARSGSAGAGLGLAIVDRVMRSHAGALQLVSTGDGLCARLELPRGR